MEFYRVIVLVGLVAVILSGATAYAIEAGATNSADHSLQAWSDRTPRPSPDAAGSEPADEDECD